MKDIVVRNGPPLLWIATRSTSSEISSGAGHRAGSSLSVLTQHLHQPALDDALGRIEPQQASSTSRATGQDLPGARFGHPKDMFQTSSVCRRQHGERVLQTEAPQDSSGSGLWRWDKVA